MKRAVRDLIRCRVAVLRTAVCLGAVLAGGSAHADYKLGPADRIQIKVVEFNQDTLVPSEWSVLAGEYRIDAQGKILMPIIGQVPASGLTVAELNQAVEDHVRNLIGMEEPAAGREQQGGGRTMLTASTEIVEYRPFFVAGAVRQTGAFPYRPGLTVLQAVSIAGGQVAGSSEEWGRERDAISASGALAGLQREELSLLARQARLQAEQADTKTIAFPAPLQSPAQADAQSLAGKITLTEKEIFLRRRAEIKRQSDSLAAQKTLLEKEAQSLLDQIKAQQTQGKLIADELKSVNILVDKGLTTTSRRLTLDRAAADIESKKLQLQTSEIQVRQDINRCERELAALLDKDQSDIATSLSETQNAIDELAAKKRTTMTLLTQLQSAGALAASAGDGIRLIYSIVRQDDASQSVEMIDVPETAAVEPGDTIKVSVQLHNQGAGIAPEVAAR